jgi:hypothetical protein
MFQENVANAMSTGFPNMPIDSPWYLGDMINRPAAAGVNLFDDLEFSALNAEGEDLAPAELIMDGGNGSDPVFTNLPADVTILRMQEDVYDVDATDTDGDALTFSIEAGPDGLIIDPGSGVVTWPKAGQWVPHPFGDHPVTVGVTDGNVNKGLVTGSLMVTVIPEPSTLVMLLGAGILGFVLWRRRRS